MTTHPSRGFPSRRALALAGSLGLALTVLPAGVALAAPGGGNGTPGAVFVQLNSPDGNEIAAYSRASDGTLAATGTYPTGGDGGTALNAPLDPLASQGGLVLTQDKKTLLAVNAGSDTLTSFDVDGSTLHRDSVVPTDGPFPNSVAVHDELVYVLNAGGEGSISGYRLHDGTLTPIPDSTRSLGLDNADVPSFITAPAQVGFSKDGRTLIITTKLNNELLTFHIGPDGRPSDSPVSTDSAGPVPFSFVVDQRGVVHVTEAGTGATSSYRVGDDGTLDLVSQSQGDGGAALCWNIRIGDTLYGANAGSSTLSSWTIQPAGSAVLSDTDAAVTGLGPIDLAASTNGRFLYVQEAVSGSLGVYQVSHDGGLARIQTIGGLPAFDGDGMEGLAAF